MHVCYPLFVVLLSANKTDTFNQIKCFEFSTNIINFFSDLWNLIVNLTKNKIMMAKSTTTNDGLITIK